ncbi:N-acetylmuramoyl-L-alanine amidase [Butyrivibrio sp. JL13D10]|uniref:N-acetylmuramoyl-L-alanine amidase n=1 Tax=Butyrivibrio sp. JL13D10 TaxID=3236815 RepID=UPI0038B44A5B
MVEKRLKVTAILTGIFVAISLGAMFYRTVTKSVIIAEAENASFYKELGGKEYLLDVKEPVSDKGKGTLLIPLEGGVSSDKITLEEKHGQHKFELYIDGKSADFYSKNAVITDLECVQQGSFTPLNESGLVRLTFQLDGLYENETSLGDKEIVVSFKKPDDLYEKVVVIDPVDEIGQKMIPYLRNCFPVSEGIKLYFTTLDEERLSAEELKALIEDSRADYFIQLGTEETVESDSGIRTFYNDRFFIRGFGNVQLADKLEMGVVTQTGDNALGLAAADEKNAELLTSTIPSAFVTIGNINNRVDHDKLEKDSYIEKCSKGVADGIKAAFAETKPGSTDEENDTFPAIISGN